MRAILWLAFLLLPLAAHAETPVQICARVGTDDTLRPIPANLTEAVNALFETRMMPQVATRTTVFRCVDRHVLVCTTGANLPCGKANAAKSSPAIANWCRQNPNSDFVPAYVTGHDTIYQWRCHAGAPEIAQTSATVDPRGFVAQYWKMLPQ